MIKSNKRDDGYKKAVASYKIWQKTIKELEEQGLHGTDYYIRRVEELEEEVKILKNKIKLLKKKNA